MQEISFAYPCTLRKDSEGRFVVRFPNVPEALTDGRTKEEALAEAVDCLRAALVGYMMEDRPLPAASPQNGRSFLGAPDTTTRMKAAIYTVARNQFGLVTPEHGRRNSSPRFRTRKPFS